VQLISAYLEQLKKQLETNKISCSDTILKALRVCRRLLPEEQLECLTNELMGYSGKQVEEMRVRFTSPDSPVAKKRSQLDSAIHRVLPGFRLKVGEDHQGLTFMGEPKTSTFFCEIGILEIEELIADSVSKAHTYTAVDFDEESNTVFVCKTKSLLNLKDAVRKKICQFLETLIRDLRGSVSESTRTWSKQTLS
jgi:uncharacterized protein (DUF2267 family)